MSLVCAWPPRLACPGPSVWCCTYMEAADLLAQESVSDQRRRILAGSATAPTVAERLPDRARLGRCEALIGKRPNGGDQLNRRGSAVRRFKRPGRVDDPLQRVESRRDLGMKGERLRCLGR
jgi:hypothetical protein